MAAVAFSCFFFFSLLSLLLSVMLYCWEKKKRINDVITQLGVRKNGQGLLVFFFCWPFLFRYDRLFR